MCDAKSLKLRYAYRKKSASRSCSDCNHYVSPGTVPPTFDKFARCRIISVAPGRAYRISPNGLCDKHDNSEYLTRFRNDMKKLAGLTARDVKENPGDYPGEPDQNRDKS